MAIHLVPTGNSIRDALATMLRYQPELVRSEGDALRLRDAELLGLDPMDRTGISGILSRMGKNRDLRNVAEHAWNRLGTFGAEGRSGWKTVISAESTSLQADRRQLTVRPDELIIFLSSDSMLSAFWNAIHVAGGPDPLDRIDYPGPAGIKAPLDGRGRVSIQTIANLGLQNPYRRDAALLALTEFTDAVATAAAPGEEIVVHLSGADRVMIPFILREASRIASRGEAPGGVRAVIVQEGSDGSEAPIEIPL